MNNMPGLRCSRLPAALGTGIVSLLLSSCAVGPNYHTPKTQLDAAFANSREPGLAQAELVQRYWTTFGDATLDGLIEDALLRNKDLGVAAANLQAARAARRLAGFDQFPTVTVAASYTKQLESQQQLPGV